MRCLSAVSGAHIAEEVGLGYAAGFLLFFLMYVVQISLFGYLAFKTYTNEGRERGVWWRRNTPSRQARLTFLLVPLSFNLQTWRCAFCKKR